MGKVKCLVCNEELESTFRHDFRQCKCENETFVDGGNDYMRAGGKQLHLISSWDEENDCWYITRRRTVWKTIKDIFKWK